MPADVHGRISRCGQDARALIRAINPAALSATQYQGAMDAAVRAFAEGDPNYSADAARKYPTYDPERARQLAAVGGDSGVGLGLSVRYGVPGDPLLV